MASIPRPRQAQVHTLCSFLYTPSCLSTSRVRLLEAISTSSLQSQQLQRACKRWPMISNPQRAFSTSPQSPHNASRYSAGSNPVRQSFGKSYRAQLAKAQKKAGIPDDVGLFQNTLIMPRGDDMPSWISERKLRTALEVYRIKSRAMDVFRLIIYKFSWGKFWSFRRRPRLNLWNREPIAKRLHKELYTAFAEGDKEKIKEICGDGLNAQFQQRIDKRPKHEQWKWTVHKYFFPTHVVSDKGALLDPENVGMRQVVVKIESLQSLEKIDMRTGKAIGSTPPARERKYEYFVIQQRCDKGELGPWKVWGTVDDKGWQTSMIASGHDLLIEEYRQRRSTQGLPQNQSGSAAMASIGK